MEKRMIYVAYLCVFFVIDFFVLNHFTLFGVAPFNLFFVRLTFFVFVLVMFLIFGFDGKRYILKLGLLPYVKQLGVAIKNLSMSIRLTVVKQLLGSLKDFFRADIVVATFSDDIANLINGDAITRATVIDAKKIESELNKLQSLIKKSWRLKKVGSIYFIVDAEACLDLQSCLRDAANKTQAWLKSNKVKIDISVLYVGQKKINASFHCRNILTISQVEFIDRISRDIDRFSDHCFESEYHAVLSSQQQDKNKKRLLSAIKLRRVAQEIKHFFKTILNIEAGFSYVRSVCVDFVPSLNKDSLVQSIERHRQRLSACGYTRVLFYIRNSIIFCAIFLAVSVLAYTTHILINNKKFFLQQDRYWQSELKKIPAQTNVKSYFSALSRMGVEISHFLLLHHFDVFNTSLLSSGLARLERYRIVHHVYPAFIEQLFPNSVKVNLSYAEVYQYIAAMIALTHRDDALRQAFLPYALLLQRDPRFKNILSSDPKFVLQQLYALPSMQTLSESQQVIFHYLIDNLFSASSNNLVLAVMQNSYALVHPYDFYFSQNSFESINQQSVITAYQEMRHINQLLQNTYHLINVHFDLPNADAIKLIFKQAASEYWKNYLNQRVNFKHIQSYEHFLCDHVNFSFLKLTKQQAFCKNQSLVFNRSLLVLEPKMQRFNDELEINKDNIAYLHATILSIQKKTFSLFNQMDFLAARTIKPLSDSIVDYKQRLLKKLVSYYLELISKQMRSPQLKQYAFDLDLAPLRKLLPFDARLISRIIYLKTVDQLFYPGGSTAAMCHFAIESLSLDSRLLDIKLFGPDFHYDYAHGPSTQMSLSTKPLQAAYQISVSYRLQNGMRIHKHFASKSALLQFFRYLNFYGCSGDVCHVSFHYHSYYWHFNLLFQHLQHPSILFSTSNRRTS